jgi:hypothetical protein
LATDQEIFLLIESFLRKAGLFWNRPILPELVQAWFEELQPFRSKPIEAAMRKYLQSEVMFPVPGALIPMIKDRVSPMRLKDEAGRFRE